MPKPKHTANFSDIHKRQLFHWVGGNIDADLRARKLTASDVREKYLTYLKDDLQNGLPIKSPKVPEKLACDGVEIPLNLPMACFTEWSLSESRPHSSRYGRMALGFSKPWIIKHGGQPVTYFNHTQKGLFLKTMVALHDFVRRLREPLPVPGLKANEIEAAFKRALYLLHFAKLPHTGTTPNPVDGDGGVLASNTTTAASIDAAGDFDLCTRHQHIQEK